MRSLAELVPLRAPGCRDAVDAIAQLAAGEDDADPAAAAHVAECLRCQAEVAAFGRVLRTMRSMRDDTSGAPEAGLAEALALVERASGVGAGRAAKVAYVSGLTAAAGVLIWFRRRPVPLTA